ncbi:serine/threonine protein kinase, CMGC, dual-specificity [Dimargaris verticillata]|uniref:dual-specificity kinase n=1 Tax=Dimargaris verticillata TaxID=2761393 RepID=A0A9W8B0F4_9FUNG|nr:serine/threonine protein kinase, CMGC, dual-specificity [Dimargaris verticillata]
MSSNLPRVEKDSGFNLRPSGRRYTTLTQGSPRPAPANLGSTTHRDLLASGAASNHTHRTLIPAANTDEQASVLGDSLPRPRRQSLAPQLLVSKPTSSSLTARDPTGPIKGRANRITGDFSALSGSVTPNEGSGTSNCLPAANTPRLREPLHRTLGRANIDVNALLKTAGAKRDTRPSILEDRRNSSQIPIPASKSKDRTTLLAPTGNDATTGSARWKTRRSAMIRPRSGEYAHLIKALGIGQDSDTASSPNRPSNKPLRQPNASAAVKRNQDPSRPKTSAGATPRDAVTSLSPNPTDGDSILNGGGLRSSPLAKATLHSALHAGKAATLGRHHTLTHHHATLPSATEIHFAQLSSPERTNNGSNYSLGHRVQDSSIGSTNSAVHPSIPQQAVLNYRQPPESLSSSHDDTTPSVRSPLSDPSDEPNSSGPSTPNASRDSLRKRTAAHHQFARRRDPSGQPTTSRKAPYKVDMGTNDLPISGKAALVSPSKQAESPVLPTSLASRVQQAHRKSSVGTDDQPDSSPYQRPARLPDPPTDRPTPKKSDPSSTNGVATIKPMTALANRLSQLDLKGSDTIATGRSARGAVSKVQQALSAMPNGGGSSEPIEKRRSRANLPTDLGLSHSLPKTNAPVITNSAVRKPTHRQSSDSTKPAIAGLAARRPSRVLPKTTNRVTDAIHGSSTTRTDSDTLGSRKDTGAKTITSQIRQAMTDSSAVSHRTSGAPLTGNTPRLGAKRSGVLTDSLHPAPGKADSRPIPPTQSKSYSMATAPTRPGPNKPGGPPMDTSVTPAGDHGSKAKAPTVANSMPQDMAIDMSAVTGSLGSGGPASKPAPGSPAPISHQRSGSRDRTGVPPLTPQVVLKVHGRYLSPYERTEILDYPHIYFFGQNVRKPPHQKSQQPLNHGYDDDRGDYIVVPHDHLVYRYEILETMGKGSFGQVLRVLDHKTGKQAAIKIIRNKRRFHCQAQIEIKLLETIRRWDADNTHHVIHIVDQFNFRNHLCIVTELLSINLYEYIRAHQFQGFSLPLIRQFAIQLLQCLILLHRHKLIHCDLKPENILLVHPKQTAIKVIDFGSSCFEHERIYSYIQSRFYRSPEVILGMSYSMGIDMWSLGCILAELYTGYPLFPGENEQDQLSCIMELLGPPPVYLLEHASRRGEFFDAAGQPIPFVNSKGKRRRPGTKQLAPVLKTNDALFLDFLYRCLEWDPKRRMSPEDAACHGWVTGMAALGPLGVGSSGDQLVRRAKGLPAVPKGTGMMAMPPPGLGGGVGGSGPHPPAGIHRRPPPLDISRNAAMMASVSNGGGNSAGSGGGGYHQTGAPYSAGYTDAPPRPPQPPPHAYPATHHHGHGPGSHPPASATVVNMDGGTASSHRMAKPNTNSNHIDSAGPSSQSSYGSTSTGAPPAGSYGGAVGFAHYPPPPASVAPANPHVPAMLSSATAYPSSTLHHKSSHPHLYRQSFPSTQQHHLAHLTGGYMPPPPTAAYGGHPLSAGAEGSGARHSHPHAHAQPPHHHHLPNPPPPAHYSSGPTQVITSKK